MGQVAGFFGVLEPQPLIRFRFGDSKARVGGKSDQDYPLAAPILYSYAKP